MYVIYSIIQKGTTRQFKCNENPPIPPLLQCKHVLCAFTNTSSIFIRQDSYELAKSYIGHNPNKHKGPNNYPHWPDPEFCNQNTVKNWKIYEQ